MPTSAEQLGTLVPPPPLAGSGPAVDPARRRAAKTYGNYALVCAGVALVLYGVATAGVFGIMMENMGPASALYVDVLGMLIVCRQYGQAAV